MALIERESLKDITIMESPIFGLLMKFENGRADIEETTNAIIDSVEEDIREEIRKAPEVDAIPISWINDWYDRYNYAEVGDLLNDWASERKDDDRKID